MEEELTAVEAAIAAACLRDDRIGRLMTIGGINMVPAAGVPSAIGEASRFASAEKLVSYLGLDRRVRQSGDRCCVLSSRSTSRPSASTRTGPSASARDR